MFCTPSTSRLGKSKPPTLSADDFTSRMERACRRSLISGRYDKVYVLQVYWDYQGWKQDGSLHTSFSDASNELCYMLKKGYLYEIISVELPSGHLDPESDSCSRENIATNILSQACKITLAAIDRDENSLIVFYYCGDSFLSTHDAFDEIFYLESGSYSRHQSDGVTIDSLDSNENTKLSTVVNFEQATDNLLAARNQHVLYLMDCSCMYKSRTRNNQWLLGATRSANYGKDHEPRLSRRFHKHLFDALQNKEWLRCGDLFSLLHQDFQAGDLEFLPIWAILAPYTRSPTGTPLLHRLDADVPSERKAQLKENAALAAKHKQNHRSAIAIVVQISGGKLTHEQIANLEYSKLTVPGEKIKVEGDFMTVVEQRVKSKNLVQVIVLMDAAMIFEMEHHRAISVLGFVPPSIPSSSGETRVGRLAQAVRAKGRVMVRRFLSAYFET